MPIARVLHYLGKAAVWAPVTAIIFSLFRFFYLRKKKAVANRGREFLLVLLVFYITVLLVITLVRDGIDWPGLLAGGKQRYGVLWIPLEQMGKELSVGWLNFLYPLVGNIVLFVPLGWLLPVLFARWRKASAVALTAFLLSLSIEISQWLLGTGVADVDDLLFNVIGGMLGYGCYCLLNKRKL